jgi:hypothetical protein
MSFDQLKNYVSSQRLSGASDEKIAEALREKHWHEDLIAKALKESTYPPKPMPDEVELGTRLLSVRELLSASWNTLTLNLSAYVLVAAATLIAPLVVMLIFLAPLIYDVSVLHFSASDFLSKNMIPVVVLHLTIGIITFMLVSFWSSLALYINITHAGQLSVHQSFKRAWERLPGFVLIGLLSALVIILGLIVFIIPGIIFSVYLTFASLVYVVHGARGKSALLSSLTLVHGRWWKTLLRIIVPSLLAGILASIAGSILPGIGTFAAQVVITPFTMIYMYILYRNYVAFDKTHPKEESIDTKTLASELPHTKE